MSVRVRVRRSVSDSQRDTVQPDIPTADADVATTAVRRRQELRVLRQHDDRRRRRPLPVGAHAVPQQKQIQHT